MSYFRYAIQGNLLRGSICGTSPLESPGQQFHKQVLYSNSKANYELKKISGFIKTNTLGTTYDCTAISNHWFYKKQIS